MDPNTKSENLKKYVCLGSDQAVISEEQYDSGLIKCGGDGCTMKGQSFVEGGRCEVCGKNYEKDHEHHHEEG